MNAAYLDGRRRRRRCDGRAAARATAVALLLGALGCGDRTASVPSKPADITGQVTAVDPSGEHIGTIRVEASPGVASGSPKAVIRIASSTVVIGPERRRRNFVALNVGQAVRVWYSGPVLESYPVRAGAATVVIDSTAR